MNPAVLVVGAGPSGLVALKEMREAGLDAIAVDCRRNFGGVFAVDSGVTCQNLHLTITNVFMSFSDFPAYDVHKGVKYWSKDEYCEYLKQYVQHFHLESHIQLRTTVNNAHFDRPSGKWQVSLSSYSDDGELQTTKKTFDKLIVATGANHKPKVPDVLSKFKGEVIHSSEFHSGDQVRGKKVLIVGSGESATDVADCATKTAKKVVMWSRRYLDCAPRFIPSFISDAGFDENKYIDQYHKPNDTLESLTTSRIVRNLPLAIWAVGIHKMSSDSKNQHGPRSVHALSYAFLSRLWRRDYFSADTSVVPTKSSTLMTVSSKGLMDILVSKDVIVDGKTLTFRDTEHFGCSENLIPDEPKFHESYDVEADVVVTCTGFSLNFDWISLSDDCQAMNCNPRSWFKHCFPPGMGEQLAFVGFARPHQGGIPQCSELVSRYIAQIYKGQLQLPPNYADLALADGASERACYNQMPYYDVVVDYLSYMMSVAKLIGCTPRPLPPWSRPLDAVKYWTFPLWPCFFRTRGVGAKPGATEFVLSKFGAFDALGPTPLLIVQMICTMMMPFINGFPWVMNSIWPQNVPKNGLPKTYQWRTSKAHFLYYNSLSAVDFQILFTQWLSVIIIIGHMILRGITTALPKR